MKEAILQKIKEYQTIIIHRHVRPDPDAYGSQGGLANILRTTFPAKQIYVVGDNEPTLSYLNTMDEIEDEVYTGALVIVCDTANQERISDTRYSKGDYLVKIDHHPNEDQYGDLLWVDTSASSTSEMIYEWYLSGKDHGLKLTEQGARLLFAGIVGDTGRFLYPSTTEKTFQYVGELIQFPFSRTELYDKMYETPINLIKLQGYILENLEVLDSGIAKVVIKKEMLEKYQARPSEASLLISSLGNIQGLLAWVFFIEEEDQIRVRLRSKGPVINEVAKKFNGGGHPRAAGASIYTWNDVERVMEEVRSACQDYLVK